jgi:hypothetical protein
MLSYERLWRLPLTGNPNNGIDIVPQLGATAGNVMTDGQVGGLLRIGKGLQADYGPIRVRPALSGTDYFDSTARSAFISSPGHKAALSGTTSFSTAILSATVQTFPRSTWWPTCKLAFRWFGRARSGLTSASHDAPKSFADSGHPTRSAP